MSPQYSPLSHSPIPSTSIFAKPCTASTSPITISALGHSKYGTPYDPNKPHHQELAELLTANEDCLTSLPRGKGSDISALHQMHRLRRIARNDEGYNAHESGTSHNSSYPQAIVRDPYSEAKRVTMGEYLECDKKAVLPNAEELGDPDMSREELLRHQAIYSIGAQVLDGPISPLRNMVIMQQPFTEYNSHPDAPSTMHILASYLSGDSKTLERMVPEVKNGSVIVQLNVKQSTSLADPEYCDKIPGTEGKITTFDSDHELFTKHGFTPSKWRFRELPVGDRSLLHIQFLDWPDGGVPATDDNDDNDDSAQLMTLVRLLADPTSCLSRPKGMSDEEASKIDPSDYIKSRALFAHCLAGKGRAGSFMVQMLDEMSHRHTARQITELTSHGKDLIARYGTDDGEMSPDAFEEPLATDDGLSMALPDGHSDALQPINLETITDPSMRNVIEHADRISAIRPVIEHEGPMSWNVDRAEERRRYYAESIRGTIRDERKRLAQKQGVEGETAIGA